jgi:hypothetical protein
MSVMKSLLPVAVAGRGYATSIAIGGQPANDHSAACRRS